MQIWPKCCLNREHPTASLMNEIIIQNSLVPSIFPYNQVANWRWEVVAKANKASQEAEPKILIYWHHKKYYKELLQMTAETSMAANKKSDG